MQFICVTNDKQSSSFICGFVDLDEEKKRQRSLIENQNKSEKLTLKGGGH